MVVPNINLLYNCKLEKKQCDGRDCGMAVCSYCRQKEFKKDITIVRDVILC